jgi:hypothetical protein
MPVFSEGAELNGLIPLLPHFARIAPNDVFA